MIGPTKLYTGAIREGLKLGYRIVFINDGGYIRALTDPVRREVEIRNPGSLRNVMEHMIKEYYAKHGDPYAKAGSDSIALQQYENLRKHFAQLVLDVLGEDYYNEGMDVYTCDEYACRDLKARMKKRGSK